MKISACEPSAGNQPSKALRPRARHVLQIAAGRASLARLVVLSVQQFVPQTWLSTPDAFAALGGCAQISATIGEGSPSTTCQARVMHWPKRSARLHPATVSSALQARF